jgi:uracil-DNA glycosylase
MADYRKSLNVLRGEWEGCTKCELGERREEVNGEFVFGEGVGERGIMFIGEGPGEKEEYAGRPFIGASGKVLRDAIEALGIANYYISNVVSCRSCAQGMSSEGQPIFRKNRLTGHKEPWIKDQPPTNPQMEACMPKLLEEIYLVDPHVIVTLGTEASKAVLGSAFSGILKDRGSAKEVLVPGAWSVPALTAKKRAWRRKVRGEYIMPTMKHQVRYWCLPTFHPSYVLRNHADQRQGNVVDLFIQDLKVAVSAYNRFVLEVHQINLAEAAIAPADILPGDEE